MVEDCTFKTHMGVKVEAEASYTPGFRAYPVIFYRTRSDHIIEVSFESVKDFRSYVKMLVRLDEQIGVASE